MTTLFFLFTREKQGLWANGELIKAQSQQAQLEVKVFMERTFFTAALEVIGMGLQVYYFLLKKMEVVMYQ